MSPLPRCLLPDFPARFVRNLESLLLVLIVGVCATTSHAQSIKFNVPHFGPFDYTDPIHAREHLPVVEQYHFTSDIEHLSSSIDGTPIGSHLLYVIRSFPNHHRALIAVTKLWERNRASARPPEGIDASQTPDFLYERAISFAESDGTVRLLYAIYLVDSGRKEKALTLLDEAARLAPDTAEIHYNLGLMYLRVGESQKADVHATKAYEKGYPLPGLRRKMIAAGIWSEQSAIVSERKLP